MHVSTYGHVPQHWQWIVFLGAKPAQNGGKQTLFLTLFKKWIKNVQNQTLKMINQWVSDPRKPTASTGEVEASPEELIQSSILELVTSDAQTHWGWTSILRKENPRREILFKNLWRTRRIQLEIKGPRRGKALRRVQHRGAKLESSERLNRMSAVNYLWQPRRQTLSRTSRLTRRTRQLRLAQDMTHCQRSLSASPIFQEMDWRLWFQRHRRWFELLASTQGWRLRKACSQGMAILQPFE